MLRFHSQPGCQEEEGVFFLKKSKALLQRDGWTPRHIHTSPAHSKKMLPSPRTHCSDTRWNSVRPKAAAEIYVCSQAVKESFSPSMSAQHHHGDVQMDAWWLQEEREATKASSIDAVWPGYTGQHWEGFPS